MNRKTFFWSVLLGAVLGQSLAMWLAPKYLVWYFVPPAPTGFDCTPPIAWALSRMQVALLVGIAAGAIGGVALSWAFTSKRNKGSDLLMR